jgi:hypothetical protein
LDVVAWRRVTPRSFVRAIRVPVLVTAIALVALLAFTDAKSVPSLMMFSLVAFVLAVVAQEFWRGASGSPRDRGRVLAVGAGPPHRIWIGDRDARRAGGGVAVARGAPGALAVSVRAPSRHELSQAWGGAALRSRGRVYGAFPEDSRPPAAHAAPLLR